jgi:hypothetical protein
MTPRRRVAALAALTLLAGSGGFAAAAATTAAGDRPQVPRAVVRVHDYLTPGPSAEYGSDWGSIGEARALAWRAPAATGSAVVEASFQYRTHGPGPFTLSVGVREVGGPRVAVRPTSLVLAPAPDGAATTVRFLAPRLPGGQTYEAQLGVNSTPPPGGRNKIATRKVLLTVDSTAR